MSGARRFGGAHSPGARGEEGVRATPRVAPKARPWAGRAVRSTSMRAAALSLWPSLLPLGALWATMSGDMGRLVGLVGAWAALLLAAKLTRDGETAAAAYARSAIARPPAIPRKLFGAALTGLGVAACGALGGDGLASAALFGALAAGLHVVAFGPDPVRGKGLDGLEGEALDAAVTRIETARRLIAEMTAAADGLGDDALAKRVHALASDAEQVVARLERNPGEMRRARRFLAVYLVGARDATVAFAQVWAETGDAAAAERYRALLDDLSAQFARSRDALTETDRAALDVEIDVLRERLRVEGV